MLGLYASGRGEWLWANLSADHDLCWIQNCYTLKTTCSLEALDFQIMWLHVFPNSARNTVTNGEHQLKNSTHQSWVFPAGHGSKMPTSHPPSSPQCDHSPAFHRPCDHDFRPSSLLHRHDVVCQTKDRQRMFITKRIKNAQKFICEKNLHGWCRSVCSHKYYISILSGMAGRCFFPPIPQYAVYNLHHNRICAGSCWLCIPTSRMPNIILCCYKPYPPVQVLYKSIFAVKPWKNGASSTLSACVLLLSG